MASCQFFETDHSPLSTERCMIAFLILELSEPYRGLMRLSDEPLRNAMTQIDR